MMDFKIKINPIKSKIMNFYLLNAFIKYHLWKLHLH